jgi:hypothetical protein
VPPLFYPNPDPYLRLCGRAIRVPLAVAGSGPKCTMKVLLQVLFYVAGHLCSIVARLNSIPRKVLNYQTPLEVFTSYMMATGRIDS